MTGMVEEIEPFAAGPDGCDFGEVDDRYEPRPDDKDFCQFYEPPPDDVIDLALRAELRDWAGRKAFYGAWWMHKNFGPDRPFRRLAPADFPRLPPEALTAVAELKHTPLRPLGDLAYRPFPRLGRINALTHPERSPRPQS